jgi:HEAT repeat protein
MRTLAVIALVLSAPAWSLAQETKKLGKTLPEWVAMMDTGNAKTKVEACQVIGDWQRGGGPAVGALVKLLHDKDALVRFAAAEALGRIGPPAKDAVPVLIELVKAENIDLRVAALDALGGIGPRAKDAVPVVVTAAGERDNAVANAALRALHHIGVASKEVVAAIKTASKDKDASVRRQAFITWADVMPDQDADAAGVAAALGDTNADVRFAALGAWTRLYRGLPAGNSALIRLLQDADPGIRKQALAMLVESCAKQIDPDVVKALQGLLNDPDGVVRAQAVQGLSYRMLPQQAEPKMESDPTLVKVLIDITKTGEPEARRAAVTALGRLSQNDAVVPLLSDKNPAVRREAAVQLLKAKAKLDAEANHVLAALLHDKDPDVRGEAARALATLGKAATTLLVQALDDPSTFVRQAAASALGAGGGQDKGVVGALQARLEDKDEMVRAAAATALIASSAKSAKAINVLRACLKSSDLSLQNSILKELIKVVVVLPVELAPALEELVLDPSPLIRRDAVLLLLMRFVEG